MPVPDLASVVPVSIIGPDPSRGLGSRSVSSSEKKDYTKITGEKLECAPMVPPEVEMKAEELTRLANYLDTEISLARSERSDYIRKLARLKEKYKAKFPEFPKDWPIANASQLIVPVIKTHVNTLGARIYQTLMAAEPPASVRTEDPEFQDFAFDYEKFLETYSKEVLDIEEILDGWSVETIKLGTGILEVTTKLDRKKKIDFDPLTGKYNSRTIEAYAGPIIYHVPLEDFWIRPAHRDPDKAPWCGKELHLTWSEIKDMAVDGELDKDQIDKIWRYAPGDGLNIPETYTKQEQLENFIPNDRSLLHIFELAVRWDVDGDGYDEELILYYHQESRTILRRKFSGFDRRPWRVGRFMLQEHWFYGEGLAEMLEHLQEEVSTMHNQRIDNATIANLRIILVARLIKGLRPGDRLWSGKVVRVQDVKSDVGTLQLGDVYPSTAAAEGIAMQYARELTGVGEAATGQAQPVTRTTATAQLALLEELNRRFDKTVKSMRRTLRGVYRDLTGLFVKMGTGGLAEEWLGPVRGRRLESFLALPSDVLRKKIKIQVTSTRASINREVEFQSQIAVWQLLIQMWQQVSTTAQTIAPQTIPLLAHEFIKAVKPVFKKVMQYADAPDPDQAISILTVLEKILPAPEDYGAMGGKQAEAQTQALLDQLTARTRGDLGGDGAAEGTNGNGRVASPASATNGTNRSGIGLPLPVGGA